MTQRRLYYHTCLKEDITWSSILLEQFTLMEEKGVLRDMDTVTVTAICDDEGRGIQLLRLLRSYDLKNLTVYFYPSTKGEAENLMMRHIWNDACVDDFQMLYLHAKGVTAYTNHLARGDAQTLKNYHLWRAFLNWGVIENYDSEWFDDKLVEYDMIGVNYFNEPAPHFSGNFWWANSRYIKTLPDPATKDWWYDLQSRTQDSWLRSAPDRFRDEMWTCSNPSVRIFSMRNLKSVTNLSAVPLARGLYEGSNCYDDPITL